MMPPGCKPFVVDDAFLTWFTGWPLGLLCWGFVGYVVVMRLRW